MVPGWGARTVTRADQAYFVEQPKNVQLIVWRPEKGPAAPEPTGGDDLFAEEAPAIPNQFADIQICCCFPDQTQSTIETIKQNHPRAVVCALALSLYFVNNIHMAVALLM